MNNKMLIELYKKESAKAFNDIPTKQIEQFVNIIINAYENENSIYVAGNGGNVASVQNLVVDLNMHPFVSEDKSSKGIARNRFKCVNLCNDSATITGVVSSY